MLKHHRVGIMKNNKTLISSISEIKKDYLSPYIFKTMYDQLPIALYILQNGKYSFVNSQAIKDLGLSEKDILGRDYFQFVYSDDESKIRELALSGVRNIEYRLLDKQGIPFWVSGSFILISHNGADAILGFHQNVNKAKEAEELCSALISSSQICFSVAQNGNYIFINESGQISSGYDAEDLVGNDSKLFVHPDDKEIVREKGIKMLKGEITSPMEFRYVTKKGQTKWVMGMMTSIVYKGQRAALGNYMDITERKLAEAEVEHSREQLRDLTAHLQSVREQERACIAYKLHDELGKILPIFKTDLVWLSKNLSQIEKPVFEKINTMGKLLDITINTVKNISSELRPGILDNLGLAEAIKWQVEEFQRRTGIKCIARIDQDEIIFDHKLTTAICNIFQEILLNIMRHAHASKVEIDLREEKSKLTLRVKDNGKGITDDQICKPNSFGLMGMKERARSFGGSFEITGKNNKGTEVFVRIPLTIKDMGQLVRIIIADAHPIFRQGLKHIISNTTDMIIAGEAENSGELFDRISKEQYDIALIDISIMGRSGFDVLKDLKMEKPKLPIIVLSTYPEEQYAIRAIRGGASGYITKDSPPDELIAALRKVSQGRKYISSSIAEMLASEVDAFSTKAPHEKLSNREYQIMLMLASGKMVGEIAGELCLSVKTISTYRARILEKMKMKKNPELTRYALDNSLID